MEIDLKELFNILIKRFWLLLIFPVIAAGIAFYVSYYILDEVYESNTTLYIINRGNTADFSLGTSDLAFSQQIVNDYKEIIISRRVTGNVVQELGITDMSAGTLAGNISVTAKNNTRLIEIRVKDKDPERAAVIANKVAEVFNKEVVSIMNLENITVVDYAQASSNPVQPRPMMNIAISIVLGLLLAVGLAFAIEFLDDSIKSSEDVEKYLGATVLGSIPEFTNK